MAILPFCGGLTGLLAGSVVAGYWQLEPNVFGGSNGGSVLSTGGDGDAVTSGYRGPRPSRRSRSCATWTKNHTLSATTTMVRTVIM